MQKGNIIPFMRLLEGQVETAHLTKVRLKYLFHDIHTILIC